MGGVLDDLQAHFQDAVAVYVTDLRQILANNLGRRFDNSVQLFTVFS